MKKVCPFICQFALIGGIFLLVGSTSLQAQTMTSDTANSAKKTVATTEPVTTNDATNDATNDVVNDVTTMTRAIDKLPGEEATDSAMIATNSAMTIGEEMMSMTTFEDFEQEWQAEKKDLMSQINILKTQTEMKPELAWYQEENVIFALMAVSGIFLLISVILFIQNSALKKSGNKIGGSSLFDKKVSEAQNALAEIGENKAPLSTLKMGGEENQKSIMTEEGANSGLGGVNFPASPTVGTPMPASALGGIMSQKPVNLGVSAPVSSVASISPVSSVASISPVSSVTPVAPVTPVTPVATPTSTSQPSAPSSASTPKATTPFSSTPIGMTMSQKPSGMDLGGNGLNPVRPLVKNQMTDNPIPPMTKPMMSVDRMGEVAKKPVMPDSVSSMMPTSDSSSGAMFDDPAQPIVGGSR